MKSLLLLCMAILAIKANANGFNNDNLETMARDSMNNIEHACLVENEAPQIKHRLMDNNVTKTTMNFGGAQVTVYHGVDGHLVDGKTVAVMSMSCCMQYPSSIESCKTDQKFTYELEYLGRI